MRTILNIIWVVFGGFAEGLGFPGGITEFIFIPHHGPHEYHFDAGWATASLAMGVIGVIGPTWRLQTAGAGGCRQRQNHQRRG